MQHDAIVGLAARKRHGARRRAGTSVVFAASGTVSIRILNAFLSRGK